MRYPGLMFCCVLSLCLGACIGSDTPRNPMKRKAVVAPITSPIAPLAPQKTIEERMIERENEEKDKEYFQYYNRPI
jgi:hypothetical protein